MILLFYERSWDLVNKVYGKTKNNEWENWLKSPTQLTPCPFFMRCKLRVIKLKKL